MGGCCCADEGSSPASASGPVRSFIESTTIRNMPTVPAGYLECHESTAQGAAREALEEANCEVEILAPYAHWDVVSISQTYILFRGRALAPERVCAKDETTDVKWVSPRDIPYHELAFSSISLALRLYSEDLETGVFRVHHGVITKTPGAGPNQPGTFALQEHIALATFE